MCLRKKLMCVCIFFVFVLIDLYQSLNTNNFQIILLALFFLFKLFNKETNKERVEKSSRGLTIKHTTVAISHLFNYTKVIKQSDDNHSISALSTGPITHKILNILLVSK